MNRRKRLLVVLALLLLLPVLIWQAAPASAITVTGCNVIDISEVENDDDTCGGRSRLRVVMIDAATGEQIGSKSKCTSCGDTAQLYLPGDNEEFRRRNCTGSCYLTAWNVWNKTKYTIKVAFDCQPPEPPPCADPDHPEWTQFTVGRGGVHAWRDVWGDGGVVFDLDVPWPEILLDVTPYPATLVNWETQMRLTELRTSAGSATAEYYSRDGGTEADPQVGDMRNIVYTVSLVPLPEWPMADVDLPGAELPPEGRIGPDWWLPLDSTVTFRWPRPSHPDASGVLVPAEAAQAGLSADTPAFVGQLRAPYKIVCSLTWEQYDRWRDESGQWVSGWRPHSQGGDVPLALVTIEDPALLAVLPDSDPEPDGIWVTNVTQRRMDEHGTPTDFTQNWGGRLVWWVREGQGQIGWPSR